jgi:hypothetical protein
MGADGDVDEGRPGPRETPVGDPILDVVEDEDVVMTQVGDLAALRLKNSCVTLPGLAGVLAVGDHQPRLDLGWVVVGSLDAVLLGSLAISSHLDLGRDQQGVTRLKVREAGASRPAPQQRHDDLGVRTRALNPDGPWRQFGVLPRGGNPNPARRHLIRHGPPRLRVSKS